MKLVYAKSALEDIQQVKQYIAKVLKNRKAADRIVAMISKNCKQLKDQPYSGASLEPRVGEPTDLRYLVCENWIAFYRVREDVVQIVRVLDGRTDYWRILLSEN